MCVRVKRWKPFELFGMYFYVCIVCVRCVTVCVGSWCVCELSCDRKDYRRRVPKPDVFYISYMSNQFEPRSHGDATPWYTPSGFFRAFINLCEKICVKLCKPNFSDVVGVVSTKIFSMFVFQKWFQNKKVDEWKHDNIKVFNVCEVVWKKSFKRRVLKPSEWPYSPPNKKGRNNSWFNRYSFRCIQL